MPDPNREDKDHRTGIRLASQVLALIATFFGSLGFLLGGVAILFSITGSQYVRSGNGIAVLIHALTTLTFMGLALVPSLLGLPIALSALIVALLTKPRNTWWATSALVLNLLALCLSAAAFALLTAHPK